MRILFTGASSFTGFWFVRELAAAGHEVVAIFRRRSVADYNEDVRGKRVGLLQSCCRAVFDWSFGDERFVNVRENDGPWDLLCHHAAEVTNYKSPEFGVAAALARNTCNLSKVLTALEETGCREVLLTGSVFEGGEGAGSEGLPHFSPYGLSKALTAEAFRFYTRRAGLRLGKFVIANPFGPYEEPRFTAYLIRTWLSGETANVRTPAYVRDNIHVSLLAKAYVDFAERLADGPGFQKLNPSGYVESQGNFALRFAGQMRRRLDLPCEVELARQTEFTEPRIRINTDMLDADRLGWEESAAWDSIAEYYSARC